MRLIFHRQRLAELFKKFSLLAGELIRNPNIDVHEQVATPGALQPGDAQVLEPDA